MALHGCGLVHRRGVASTLLCTVISPHAERGTLEGFALPAETDADAFLTPWPELNCAFGSPSGSIQHLIVNNSLKRNLALQQALGASSLHRAL